MSLIKGLTSTEAGITPENDCFSSTGDLQFTVDVCDVIAHCFFTKKKAFGYLLIAQSPGNQVKNLNFSMREFINELQLKSLAWG